MLHSICMGPTDEQGANFGMMLSCELCPCTNPCSSVRAAVPSTVDGIQGVTVIAPMVDPQYIQSVTVMCGDKVVHILDPTLFGSTQYFTATALDSRVGLFVHIKFTQVVHNFLLDYIQVHAQVLMLRSPYQEEFRTEFA